MNNLTNKEMSAYLNEYVLTYGGERLYIDPCDKTGGYDNTITCCSVFTELPIDQDFSRVHCPPSSITKFFVKLKRVIQEVVSLSNFGYSVSFSNIWSLWHQCKVVPLVQVRSDLRRSTEGQICLSNLKNPSRVYHNSMVVSFYLPPSQEFLRLEYERSFRHITTSKILPILIINYDETQAFRILRKYWDSIGLEENQRFDQDDWITYCDYCTFRSYLFVRGRLPYFISHTDT